MNSELKTAARELVADWERRGFCPALALHLSILRAALDAEPVAADCPGDGCNGCGACDSPNFVAEVTHLRESHSEMMAHVERIRKSQRAVGGTAHECALLSTIDVLCGRKPLQSPEDAEPVRERVALDYTSDKHITHPEAEVCCEVEGCECTQYSDPFWALREETD